MRARHEELIRRSVEESIAVKVAFFATMSSQIVEAAESVAVRLRAGGKILLFGNGGSAADAQHLAAEFVNRMRHDRPALAALALTTDSSALTSIANDLAYERVFSRQIEALGGGQDVAIGITTSGNSPNVLVALEMAEAKGMLTIGLLGRDGGKCREHCRYPLVVEARDTQRIQESHLLAGHLLAELIEDHLYPRESA